MKKQYWKRQWLGAALGLGAMWTSSIAVAQDAAKVYYNEGTTIETKDFNLKLNLLIQPTFTYTDRDSEGRSDLGLDPAADSTSFDLRYVRLNLAGDALAKQFSYALYHDFAADGGGSELQDAWLQWNSDWGSARWGQFDVPFSRQELAADHGAQLLDRSLVSNHFAPAREMGAMLHGPIASGLGYAAGIFNGVEGQNEAGVDNKLLYSGAVTWASSGYGNRAFEGDLRENNASFEATAGSAAYYLEGTNVDGIDVNQFGLNVDGGIKVSGFSAQTEFYYENIDADESGIPSADNWGFYAQGGYMLDRNWELAGRFGYIDPDDGEGDALDLDTQEYSAVVNYYVNGHNLKFQGGVNWIVDNVGDDDTSDFEFVLQMTGWV